MNDELMQTVDKLEKELRRKEAEVLRQAGVISDLEKTNNAKVQSLEACIVLHR